jgi:gluconolactonase
MDAGPVGLDQIETFAHGLDHPEGITITADGRIFVGGEAGQIYLIEDDTATEVANTGGFILGIAADAAGRIYAADNVHKCVWRIVPETGHHEVYASGTPDRRFNVPNWGAFDAAGNLYLTDSGGWEEANGLIWRVRPGGHAEVWTETAVDFPNGCAVSPDGRCLFCVSPPVTPTIGPNKGGRAVYMIDPDGFRVELIQSSMGFGQYQPTDTAAAPPSGCC